jgi:hypothetical protein
LAAERARLLTSGHHPALQCRPVPNGEKRHGSIELGANKLESLHGFSVTAKPINRNKHLRRVLEGLQIQTGDSIRRDAY